MADTETQQRAEEAIAYRRRRVIRSAFVPILGIVLLMLAILLRRDAMNRERTVQSIDRFRAVLGERVGVSGSLPLNLSPTNAEGAESVPSGMSWLSRDDARLLRDFEGPIIAAYTIPLDRVFLPDGRAAVIFEAGTFRVDWLPVNQFDQHLAEQQARLEQRAELAKGAIPQAP